MQLFWEVQKQRQEVFYKKVVLKSLANFTEKQLGLQLYYKVNLTQVFSYEIWEIFKNTFFQEHL